MDYFSNRVKMIFSFPANAVVAEIGVYTGDFAKVIHQLTTPKELYLIDLWECQKENDSEYNRDPTNNAPLNQYYKNICNDFNNIPSVNIIKNWSHLVAETFPNNYFDWIYLDADHTYPAVKRDLKAWLPKIKSGGIFAGHDYLSHLWIEVKLALDEFMNDNGLQLSHFSYDEPPSWAFTVP